MIRINGEEFKQNHYPDGTALVRYDKPFNEANTILWNYENDAEIFAIYCIARDIQKECLYAELVMPYIPHARMDRVKDDKDVFTLKYFCEIINACNFGSVYVLDPHSSVSEALIERIIKLDPLKYIDKVLNYFEETPLLFYPDEGSMKRYSGMINSPYVFGVKKRDWKTGAIQGLDVVGDTDSIKGKDILIIDDICSRGGTFYHSAKKLKELGAGKIYLYISHCENTIFEGELLSSGLIERVFTTNSIYKSECKMITAMKI